MEYNGEFDGEFCVVCCTVMEIACGEYGDVVPKLVVAAQNASCAAFHNADTSEVKPNNYDTSTKLPDVMDSKYSLQDGINVDNLLPGYSELLSVQKLAHDVSADEVNYQISSDWKTLDCPSSDTTSTSSKLVSTGFCSIPHCLINCFQ